MLVQANKTLHDSLQHCHTQLRAETTTREDLAQAIPIYEEAVHTLTQQLDDAVLVRAGERFFIYYYNFFRIVTVAEISSLRFTKHFFLLLFLFYCVC